MRIRITTTFIDRQAADPDKAEIGAGTEMTVAGERGAELVAAGVAEEVTAPTAGPKPRVKRLRKAATAAIPPEPELNPDADPAPNA